MAVDCLQASRRAGGQILKHVELAWRQFNIWTTALVEIVKEMKELGYNVGETSPTVRCTLFEDNCGAITIANAPAMQPRTKHINNKYHHFRSFVANGQVTILAVKSKNQCADMVTKPNNVTDLVRHRKRVMGW